ncbi:MAG TPA: NfeD family protein [Candidatus Polarisedimenticolia bacterium]|nr:NfeD family protein [Candidatus Polarisedimenticolia bacterium]
MTTFWNWTLILSGATLILIEVALGGFAGFDLVLIGSAFVVGGAIGLAFHHVYLGLFISGVLCAAYILGGRRYVKAKIHVKGVESNADAVVGQRGVVLARIAPHQAGRVRVKDEEWRAALAEETAGAIAEGAEITVAGVDGVTLLVR